VAQLVIVILDDLSVLPDLLAGWRRLGVPGATILESVGAYRAENWLSRTGLAALGRLFEAEEVRRRMVLAAIEDELVGPVVAEAERVVGGFSRPNSGLLLVIPITQVLGLTKSGAAGQPAPTEAERAAVRGTSVLTASAQLRTEPTLIGADLPLTAVIQAMLAHPNTEVAAVVTVDGRLVGLLDVHALADSLFVHIFPEDYLAGISDLEKVRQFAEQTQAHRARDLMRPPQAVARGENVRDALHRMHKVGLAGLPIVDDEYRVVGYVSVLELLAVLASEEGSAPGGKAPAA
jgi:CBS domain-containing protein